MKIGFIGQWFLGWNYANNFENRWYEVVRYSKNRFPQNFQAMQECEYVIVWVPTPTVDRKFDDSVLLDAIASTVAGQKIVIKSTILPWTTDKLQSMYPDRFFFHSAEFLAERSAAHDVANPTRNVVGYTEVSKPYAEDVIGLFAKAPYNFIVTAKESELGKYMSNVLLATKVIMANMFYEVCEKNYISYNRVKEIAGSDPRIWMSHLEVDFEWGRWANWHCFPKDLSAFHQLYGIKGLWHILLEALEMYNLDINLDSGKQTHIIKPIYWL